VDGLQPLERKVAQYNPYLRLPDKKYPQQASMEKPHINDACIDSNLKAIRTDEQYRFGFKRKNNRQLHKANYLKGAGRRTTRHRISSKGFASWIGWTIRETPVLFLALEPGVISIFDSLKA